MDEGWLPLSSLPEDDCSWGSLRTHSTMDDGCYLRGVVVPTDVEGGFHSGKLAKCVKIASVQVDLVQCLSDGHHVGHIQHEPVGLLGSCRLWVVDVPLHRPVLVSRQDAVVCPPVDLDTPMAMKQKRLLYCRLFFLNGLLRVGGAVKRCCHPDSRSSPPRPSATRHHSGGKGECCQASGGYVGKGVLWTGRFAHLRATVRSAPSLCWTWGWRALALAVLARAACRGRSAATTSGVHLDLAALA